MPNYEKEQQLQKTIICVYVSSASSYSYDFKYDGFVKMIKSGHCCPDAPVASICDASKKLLEKLAKR